MSVFIVGLAIIYGVSAAAMVVGGIGHFIYECFIKPKQIRQMELNALRRRDKRAEKLEEL